jgi:NADH-quinone oxidoreductase subunit C
VETLNNIIEKHGDAAQIIEDSVEPAVYVEKDNLEEIMSELKNNKNFKLLADLTAVDYEDYMEVVYHLMNVENCQVIKVKSKIDRDNLQIKSLSNIWKAAVIQEREVYDLMGIKFLGHPNLKRILCPDDFEGHPLRKDFKIEIRGVK